jgi:hypothetical protein
MSDGDEESIDRILFSLGIVDLERALVETLVKAGHASSNFVVGRSGDIGEKVRQLAVQANLPDHPGVGTCVEYGTLSVLAMLCEILIARDLLDPESLIEAAARKAKFWRSENSVYRALPAEIVLEALMAMAAEKKDVDQTLAASRSAVRSGRVQ